jgi:hypothetical protein
MNKPKWWTPEDDSAWDRVKGAMKRDWEQTKADLTGGRKGTDIDQDVDDTVKQAFGLGVGARRHYANHTEWDDRLESKLKEEWGDLKSGKTWDEVKASVRSGWDRARR